MEECTINVLYIVAEKTDLQSSSLHVQTDGNLRVHSMHLIMKRDTCYVYRKQLFQG